VTNRKPPLFYVAFCRVLALSLLTGYWIIGSGHEVGALLLLFLTALTVARWRLALPAWSVVLDLGGCLLAASYWPGAWYGAALIMFEIMLAAALPLLVVIIPLIVFFDNWSIPLAGILILSGLCGWLLRRWSQDHAALQHEADTDRRHRYEAEAFKHDLLTAATQASQVAELTERQRISQELHDHVGHEVTAALLALQAFSQLWREGDPQAEQLLTTAQVRLDAGARQLRETVYNLYPVASFGLQRFQDICRGFPACPVDLNIHGDTSRIHAYQWRILEACLKEALTNVLRHASAQQVTVSLDTGPHILRLSIGNDGVVAHTGETGIGLKNLRLRVQSAGGSMTTDARNGFRLVCVLPLEHRS
jgi:two-component system, NarL family, sensor histidine kinase DesK